MMGSSVSDLEKEVTGNWYFIRDIKPVDVIPEWFCFLNLLNPTGHVIRQQFNIQQLYALPTLYLCVLYLYENKQWLVTLTSQTDWLL